MGNVYAEVSFLRIGKHMFAFVFRIIFQYYRFVNDIFTMYSIFFVFTLAFILQQWYNDNSDGFSNKPSESR